MLNRIFRTRPEKQAAKALYDGILAASRNAKLFAELGVPDTIEGRVESVMLHTALVIRELQASGDEYARTVSQEVFDAMFDDFDSAMRELGVGDSGVGKKIRFLAEGFYGRAQAYSDALEAEDSAGLAEAISRNLLASETVAKGAGALADYAVASAQSLAGQGAKALGEGTAPVFAQL